MPNDSTTLYFRDKKFHELLLYLYYECPGLMTDEEANLFDSLIQDYSNHKAIPHNDLVRARKIVARVLNES